MGASDFRHPSTEERGALRGVECRFEDAGFALRPAPCVVHKVEPAWHHRALGFLWVAGPRAPLG